MAQAKIVDGVLRTKFAGYCGKCGCMRGAHDDGCPKCGSSKVTQTAPKPLMPPPDRRFGQSPYASFGDSSR